MERSHQPGNIITQRYRIPLENNTCQPERPGCSGFRPETADTLFKHPSSRLNERNYRVCSGGREKTGLVLYPFHRGIHKRLEDQENQKDNFGRNLSFKEAGKRSLFRLNS